MNFLWNHKIKFLFFLVILFFLSCYSLVNTNIFFDASAKKVTSSYKSTDRNLVTLKTRATLDAKETAYSLIKRLDWLVERLAYDSSKAIPDAVKTYVAAIRTDCATIETAITNASDMTAFKKLYSDGTIDKWTGDTNVSAYLR